MIFDLISAVICGLIIGLERKYKQKPAGFKTMVLISVGSMLYTFGSLLFPNSDPLRVVGQIVTGVGFLGAGVIIKGTGARVSGLTTAALIWVSSSLGVLCGMGYGLLGIIIAAIVTGLTILLGYTEARLFPKLEDKESNGNR